MTDAIDIFPKNDLMKGALQPLVGDSLFVSDGETWKRQRRMVEPAFSFMRITKAFAAMQKAVAIMWRCWISAPKAESRSRSTSR